ncbi:hypothetical protein FHX48_000742 [Microbacterium halimionae]|uniref:Uncharacterized protein n=2 Tax=Microbacterium halimionae TaxID=1526413 RepID=A0A7W3JMT4_9MICO|nr:hypothetical protein [Microbacterium halimionae]
MKLHAFINAEGDLAERSDPHWVAALTRHVFALDGLTSLDDRLTLNRAPVPLPLNLIEALDVDLLADAAVVDVDERPTRSGGTFSSFDLRDGAVRTLSRSGVVAPRRELAPTIDVIAEQVHRKYV